MKKKVLITIIILLTIMVPSTNVKADMFSKPTAIVDVVGVEKEYSFEVLTKIDTVKLLSIEELEAKLEQNYYEPINYPKNLFNGYQDSDNYASRTLYTNKPATIQKLDSNKFKIGYFNAPKELKVAIIVEGNILLVSKIIERKLFDSELVFDLTGVDLTISNNNVGIVKENIPYRSISWKFVVRVIITIIVELLILLMFNYKNKKSYIVVGLTNFVTQSILTIFMIISFYVWGKEFGLITAIIIGEAFVFLAEIIVYRFILTEKTTSRATIYAVVANTVTVLISIFTMSLI